jgi:hypothetical protein
MSNLAHGRTRWILIAWLFVLSAIGYLNRVNMSVAGSSIIKEFHLSPVAWPTVLGREGFSRWPPSGGPCSWA